MAVSISGVTPASMRTGLMRGLLGSGGLFGAADVDLEVRITDAIDQAERSLEADLSFRFAVTAFQGWMGPGASPDPVAGQEWEGPYAWPPSIPGDNFPRWRTKIRPIVALNGLTVIMPGGIQIRVDIPSQWCRVDHPQGEIMVAPSLFNAPLQSAGLTGPLILGITGRQLPMSVLIDYTAGLGVEGMKKWPQIKRLVEYRASLYLLPDLAIMANPETLGTISADGLSQSRTSGYIFKDLEERLNRDAESLLERLLSLWDGPGSLMVL